MWSQAPDIVTGESHHLKPVVTAALHFTLNLGCFSNNLMQFNSTDAWITNIAFKRKAFNETNLYQVFSTTTPGSFI